MMERTYKQVLSALVVIGLQVLGAQTPVDQLATPPPTSQHYTVLSIAGKHGKASLWTLPDGTRMERDSVVLRGMVAELDEAVKLNSKGIPTSIVVRGSLPQGDASETFQVSEGIARWKSTFDQGQQPFSEQLYVPGGGSFVVNTALMIEALLASSNKTLPLLPGGMAKAERLTESTVGAKGTKKTVVCWAISGLGPSPSPVWATKDGKYFGEIGGLSFLPEGYEGELKAMTVVQDEAMAKYCASLARGLARTPRGVVAFTHVRAFLDGNRFAEDVTVIVKGTVIMQVGPASTTPVPNDATVFDGKGRTLVPGLWDSHMHVGGDYSGAFLLSLGITSGRDPGNDDAMTVSRALRRQKGELLLPKIYPSSLIDGKGPNTAQFANVATTQEEALAGVRKAKQQGFTGVKIYGTFNPAWVAASAAEAHRLGLKVHGHIPAGMLTHEAIEAGYDEITHINYVMMEAMPENVVRTSNGFSRFQATVAFAKDVALDADPMKSLIASMAQRQITSDPTLVVFEGMYVPDKGEMTSAYAPFVGTLPPATERGFRSGGWEPPKGLTRSDCRKSFAKLVALVGALHKAGVPIVAGTDGMGIELVRELELYIQAGFTPEEALASATIVPAQNVGVGDRTGSIAVGKVADLVLVEGDPSKNVSDLRNTRLVMMDGKIMDADELRTAAGFSGRPATAPVGK